MNTFTPRAALHNLPSAELLGIQAKTSAELIALLQNGIGFVALENVAAAISQKPSAHSSLAEYLGISLSTYQRRKLEQKLTPKESEGVYRYAALLTRATEVFEHPNHAKTWLNQPNKALGNVIPLEYARTELGASLVMQLLGRIEHGSYS